ncbi:hypothetical protein DFJ74DRAFT_686706 [Hyaloraphidium curvatum]|nr:hypothetical protein DFJ74DRAFT_686706 [Hyaloraphidium curvatum]
MRTASPSRPPSPPRRPRGASARPRATAATPRQAAPKASGGWPPAGSRGGRASRTAAGEWAGERDRGRDGLPPQAIHPVPMGQVGQRIEEKGETIRPVLPSRPFGLPAPFIRAPAKRSSEEAPSVAVTSFLDGDIEKTSLCLLELRGGSADSFRARSVPAGVPLALFNSASPRAPTMEASAPPEDGAGDELAGDVPFQPGGYAGSGPFASSKISTGQSCASHALWYAGPADFALRRIAFEPSSSPFRAQQPPGSPLAQPAMPPKQTSAAAPKRKASPAQNLRRPHLLRLPPRRLPLVLAARHQGHRRVRHRRAGQRVLGGRVPAEPVGPRRRGDEGAEQGRQDDGAGQKEARGGRRQRGLGRDGRRGGGAYSPCREIRLEECFSGSRSRC